LFKGFTQKRCTSCHSSFHEIWGPLAKAQKGSEDSPKTVLTVTKWDVFEVPCFGCKEGLANPQGHMDYGGCLYQSALDMDLTEPMDLIMFPPLPPSPK
jgi:hypothetical protein